MSPIRQPRARVLRPRPDQRGSGRTARLERTLVHIHVVILVAFALATLAPLVWDTDPGDVETVARVGLVLLYVGVAADLLLRGERAVHLAVLSAGLVLALGVEAAERPGDIAPALAYSALATSGARLLRLVPFGLGLLAAGAAYAVAVGAMERGASGPQTLDRVLLGAALAVSIASFVASLEEDTRRAERLDEEALAREGALQREQSQEGAVVAAGRVLHDDVLTTLRLVADDAQQHLGPEAVKDSCRTSARAVRAGPLVETGRDPADHSLDLSPPSPRLGQTLAEVVDRAAPVTVRLGVAEGLDDLVLPPEPADALSRALGEVLRNVARHSGTLAAEVRVTETDGVLLVRVVDRGTGFPAGLDEGYGLSRSVRAALAPHGGQTRTRATAGGGATVELVLPRPRPAPSAPVRPWSRAGLERTYRYTVLTSGGSISLVRAIAWPQGLAWVYLAVRYAWGTPSVPTMLALLLGLVALAALVAGHLERRPPTPRWTAAVATALVAAQVTGLLLLPAGGMLDYRSWPVGLVSVPVMTLCLFLPRRLGLLVLLPHPLAVVVAAVVEPSLSAGAPPLGSLNASLLTPLLGVALGGLLRRTGHLVVDEQERLAAAERALAQRRAAAEVSSVHLEHTREVVVPWLEEVAESRVDLALPATQDTARTLSMEVRDDLYAPGLFDARLRRLVSQARRRGAVVEVGAGFAPGAADRTTGLLLRELVPRMVSGTKLTVVVHEGHARLSLVPPDAGLVAHARRLVPRGLRTDVDEFRAVLRYADAPENRGMASDRRTG